MIRRLSGTVVGISLTHITVDVSGVGYLIAVRSVSEFSLDKPATLHTYLAVRENALDLYGFLHEEELEMFELLLKVPKVGPKTALQILIQASVSLLQESIASEDPVHLSKLSGISKKSAEKIVSELKGSFDGLGIENEAGTHTSIDSDVIDALVTLGYSEKDARHAVQKLDGTEADTNARIKKALHIITS